MDALYLFKPDKSNEAGVFATKYKAEDKVYKLILNEITSLPSELKVEQIIFKGDKKADEKFLETIFNLTDSLLKANSFRRDYKTKQKFFEKQFRKRLYTETNKKTLDIYDDPLELKSQLDSFLTQIKASLDNLVYILNPLLRSNFDRWGKAKDKDGVERSGLRILHYVKNLSKNPILDDLIKHIESKIDWISYLVRLRDKPLHKGGNSALEGFIFDHIKKNISKPYIKHSDGTTESIEEFLDKTMDEIIRFISTTIIIAIQYNAPKGFFIVKTLTERGDTEYQWRITY